VLGNSSASRSETCVLDIDIRFTNLDFKFKADNFDGSVPLREFLM